MKFPRGFPVRVVVAMGTGVVGTVVAAFWWRLPTLPSTAVVGVELLGICYYLVVGWNPSVKSLIGIDGPSSVVRTCGPGIVYPSIQDLDRMKSSSKINSGSYYEEYHGHRLDHLVRVRSKLLDQGCDRFVYFCGDSSLDNKHWCVFPQCPSIPSVVER